MEECSIIKNLFFQWFYTWRPPKKKWFFNGEKPPHFGTLGHTKNPLYLLTSFESWNKECMVSVLLNAPKIRSQTLNKESGKFVINPHQFKCRHEIAMKCSYSFLFLKPTSECVEVNNGQPSVSTLGFDKPTIRLWRIK